MSEVKRLTDPDYPVRIDFDGLQSVTIRASQLTCPSCGGHYERHPTRGLIHVCSTVKATGATE